MNHTGQMQERIEDHIRRVEACKQEIAPYIKAIGEFAARDVRPYATVNLITGEIEVKYDYSAKGRALIHNLTTLIEDIRKKHGF